MRTVTILSIVLSLAVWAQPAAKPTGTKKDATAATPPLPKGGVKAPGVQIPFASLKPEAEFPVAPHWLFFADAPLLPNAEKNSLDKIDTKENKIGDFATGLHQPCGGVI